MSSIRKFLNNFLTSRAVSVLGPKQYCLYFGALITRLPDVIRCGDLRPVDKQLGDWKVEKFQMNDINFLIDCEFCDRHIQDGSFAFGIVREIYIRNCYFKYHLPTVFTRSKTVVDLGANRGVFSVLMASQADLVICVEAHGQFAPVIQHNMAKNRYNNYAIEVGFIGVGGKLSNTSICPRLTIGGLMKRYNLQRIDFMKMDIEGSEFALFENVHWLHRVNAISMEVHQAYGDTNFILQSLAKHGFVFTMADENLRQVKDPKCANFIYAWQTAMV